MFRQDLGLSRTAPPRISGSQRRYGSGHPETGEPIEGDPSHRHHIWRVDQVRSLVMDHSEPITFFCGGSRNLPTFEQCFDAIFVLDIDEQTLSDRLERRPADEFGAKPEERELIQRLHRTRGTPAQWHRERRDGAPG